MGASFSSQRFSLLSAVLPLLLQVNAGIDKQQNVKKLVVLMMENRSFDHLLGWLEGVEGLDGSQFNNVNSSDPNSEKIFVTQNAPDRAIDDPQHTFSAVTHQIYGYDKPVSTVGVPNMSGFADMARTVAGSVSNPLSMFTPETAPIINTLANEFGVMNRWFCSLPGPTDPNRAFAMSGTSNGMTDNFNHTLWSQQSYFDFLGERGVEWRAYYQDDPWAVMYFHDMVNKPENAKNAQPIERFFADVAAGQLPDFTWLQPRMTSQAGPPSWQHPDASLMEGERLIKEVYEALRSSVHWEELALLLTYDEHGGFYDHVVPPQEGIPSPDGVPSPEGFGFDRLGVRVPSIVISPWVPRAQRVFAPSGPTASSQYDHASIIATANSIFGIEDRVSYRVDWAGRFDWMFSQLPAARADCPTLLPELPAASAEDLLFQQQLPLNDHLELQVEFYCRHGVNKDQPTHGPGCGKKFTNQLEASHFIAREAEAFVAQKQQRPGDGGSSWAAQWYSQYFGWLSGGSSEEK